MIRFACPQCGKAYKADDALAGRPSACKRCGAVAAVPGPAIAAALPVASPPSTTREEGTPRPDGGETEPSRGRRRRRFRRTGRGEASDVRSAAVNAVAVVFVLAGVAILLGGLALVVLVAAPTEPGRGQAADGVAFFGTLGAAIVLSVPFLFGSYGVWHRRPWGRLLGLALAGLSILGALPLLSTGFGCLAVVGVPGVFAAIVLGDRRYAREFE